LRYICFDGEHLDYEHYGNYGGPGWTNGGPEKDQFPDRNPKPGQIGPPYGDPPIDDQDACYLNHDRGYAACKWNEKNLKCQERMRKCKRAVDEALIRCLIKARSGPRPGSLCASLMAQTLFENTNRDPKRRPPGVGCGGNPAK